MPSMQLDVIGAGPAYTDRPGATGAAYLVRAGGSSILLDLGQGSFSRLAGLLDPATLDAVVVSHLHPDHFIDLVPLRHYLRWEKPRRRVRVLGPAGLGARLDALHGEPGFSAAALDIEALAEASTVVGGFTVRAARVRHTESSYGFRVAPASAPDGRGLVYSGDCGRAEDLDPLMRPGDALLCEVSFGPGPVVTDAEHLDAPAVGDLARRTGAGRVLLTHLQMGYDRAETVAAVRARYDGPVDLVDPGFATTI
jgi:ribonuclease BN (tRNA processing enzyme)